MATPERWSRTVGARRGPRAKIYERTPGGVLYIAVQGPGTKESRSSLGHRDRVKAMREAEAVLKLLKKEKAPSLRRTGALTLGDLFRRYVTDGKYLPDGSLKTEPYLKHCAKTGRNLAAFFGEDLEISRLTPDRVAKYVRARRVGDITGRAVGTNCIKQELRILKAALNWACGVHVRGKLLLERNPLEKLKVPQENDPKRPMIEAKTVDALLRIAPSVHPFLPALITLASTTGRRLSSILGLRWDDFDFGAEAPPAEGRSGGRRLERHQHATRCLPTG